MAILRHASTVCRTGMTLIELILALAIASLVITLVFSVYRTVSVTMQGQEERRRGADDAANAVRQIARDLTCTFAPKSDATCEFDLQKDSHGPFSSQLSFCSAITQEGETNLLWFELHCVAYRVGVDEKNKPVLLREYQPLTGPGALAPPVTNVLAGEVESFHVTVLNGSEWNDEWTSTSNAPCPRAACIEVTTRYGAGTKTFRTEVLIPAGNSISSTVTRTVL
jgi:prepilin-type N-terminal cleavage/methylation domain-containing protein